MAATLSHLQNLTIALEQYRLDFHEYPPDASMDARFDLGSECLVYYLGSAFRTAPDVSNGGIKADRDAGPYFEFVAEDTSDVDGDGNKEFVDGWGTPYMYDNIRDDPAGYTDCGHPRFGPDPRGGRPWNVDSYDVWSQGEPGRAEPVRPRRGE